jgi:regulator of replication initiation timing
MNIDFTLQKLDIEITQLEKDIANLKEMKKMLLYEDLRLEIESLIKKLGYKKRSLQLRFKKTYAEFLEYSDFVSSVEF